MARVIPWFFTVKYRGFISFMRQEWWYIKIIRDTMGISLNIILILVGGFGT